MSSTITRRGCVFEVVKREGGKIVARKYFDTLAAAQRYADSTRI